MVAGGTDERGLFREAIKVISRVLGSKYGRDTLDRSSSQAVAKSELLPVVPMTRASIYIMPDRFNRR